jgi:hypothetical protein
MIIAPVWFATVTVRTQSFTVVTKAIHPLAIAAGTSSIYIAVAFTCGAWHYAFFCIRIPVLIHEIGAHKADVPYATRTPARHHSNVANILGKAWILPVHEHFLADCRTVADSNPPGKRIRPEGDRLRAVQNAILIQKSHFRPILSVANDGSRVAPATDDDFVRFSLWCTRNTDPTAARIV